MYQFFDTLIANISNVMYSYLLIIMLLAVGIYFTFRTKFVQLRLLGESIRVVTEKKDDGSVSSFQALMVSTASRVGTGNIVGVANAIAIGGYGAVFHSRPAFADQTHPHAHRAPGKVRRRAGGRRPAGPRPRNPGGGTAGTDREPEHHGRQAAEPDR